MVLTYVKVCISQAHQLSWKNVQPLPRMKSAACETGKMRFVFILTRHEDLYLYHKKAITTLQR